MLNPVPNYYTFIPMSAAELLAELTESFQHEPYPGDFNLVTNNAPNYDLESLEIREAFKIYTWQTIPDELLLYERAALSFLSDQGLKYYLPAFIGFAVREYVESDSIPDDMVNSMTLPAEIDELKSALYQKRYRWDQNMPAIDWDEHTRERLRDMNGWVHYFFKRYGQFDRAQSRAILHFLEYLRDQHGEDYLNNEPAVAIERYWFQFA